MWFAAIVLATAAALAALTYVGSWWLERRAARRFGRNL